MHEVSFLSQLQYTSTNYSSENSISSKTELVNTGSYHRSEIGILFEAVKYLKFCSSH